MTAVDYASVDIPDETVEDPTTWSWRERRAELLQMCLRAGGPTRLPTQRALAKRYGVSQSQISQDLDALGEYVDLGGDIEFTIESAFHAIYDELMEAGEYRDAWKVVEGYEKLAERRGAIPREPHKFDVRHGEVPTETESYELVTDDDEVVEGDVITADDLQPELPPAEGRPADPEEEDDD